MTASAQEGGPAWRADVAAGLAMAGLLLPEAIAYAGIAGMPPAAGIIGLVAGLAAYALIGRSRFALVSATSSAAAVAGAATASLAGGDTALQAALAAGLVMLTGLAFVAAAAAQIGAVASFIARPVLRGFGFGLAATITLKQLQQMSGWHAPHAMVTLSSAAAWLADAARWNGAGLALGTSVLALLLLARRLHALAHVPTVLAVLVVGTLAAEALQLAARGVAVVGPVALAWSWPDLPALSRPQWLRLAELALALAVLLFAESTASIRSAALAAGDPVQPNRDLVALGAANLLAGAFHGTPVGAGFSATNANVAAGARSRASGLVALAAVLVAVALALPWVARVPEPVLAAIVVSALAHALSPAVFRPYWRWRRDRAVAVAAAVAVVLLGVLDGLLAAIAFSVAMTLRDLARARVIELGRVGGHDFLPVDGKPPAARVDGVLVLRPESLLFFANAEPMLAAIRRQVAAASPRAVVLSLEESPDLDSTAVETLAQFATECDRAGRTLAFARLKPLALDVLRRAGLAATARLVEGSVDDAVGIALRGQGTG